LSQTERSEVQQHPLARRQRALGGQAVDRDVALVPDDGMEAGVVHARRRRLRRERHDHRAVEEHELLGSEPAFGEADVLVVEAQTPLAAQVDPVLTHELGSRIAAVLT
jgi:hypothetical protein